MHNGIPSAIVSDLIGIAHDCGFSTFDALALSLHFGKYPELCDLWFWLCCDVIDFWSHHSSRLFVSITSCTLSTTVVIDATKVILRRSAVLWT